MRYLSQIVTSLIRMSLIFLVAYVWTNEYIKNSYIIITISAILSISIECLIFFYNKKKNIKIKTNKQDEKTKELWQTILSLKDKNYVCKLIEQIYKNEKPVIKNSYIIITNTSTLIFPIFFKEKIQIIDINTIYNISLIENISKIEIICTDIEDSAKELINKISDKNITICNMDKFYKDHLKPSQIQLPEGIQIKQPKRNSFKQWSEVVFNKKLIKNYILGGIFLFFTSFFTKYAILYEIMGTVMIAFAFVSMLKKSNLKSNY